MEDVSLWTVVGTIAAILAVLVPIYHRWTDQHRRWTVTITIGEPVRGSVRAFDVTIRNDGKQDLIIPGPAAVRIFDVALSKETSVPLQFRRGPSGPPWHIQTEEELTSYTTVTGLADALRMRGCMTTCRVERNITIGGAGLPERPLHGSGRRVASR